MFENSTRAAPQHPVHAMLSGFLMTTAFSSITTYFVLFISRLKNTPIKIPANIVTNQFIEIAATS